MSYILDALRRADAERERGAVPGLHAQNIPADPEPAARDHRPLIWAAAGAGGLMAVVVAVLVFGPWRAAPTPGARTTLAQAPVRGTAARGTGDTSTAEGETPSMRPGGIEPAARPVEPPIARATGTATGSTSRRVEPAAALPLARADGNAAQATRLADRAAAGRVGVVEPRADAVREGRAALTDKSAEGVAPAANHATPYDAATAAAAAADAQVEHYGPAVAATPPPPARAGATPSAIASLNDLSPSQRAQLPKLTPGGAIYSDAPSARMLILNGQIYHEGDKPAADTVLEQIKHKSAVLNFRGQRYEIAF